MTLDAIRRMARPRRFQPAGRAARTPGRPSPSAARWVVVSTFPPTACGLATFTRSLVDALRANAVSVDVMSVVDAPSVTLGAGVVHELVASPGDVAGVRAAADVLNTYDVVLVQHEYGIYSGPDGEDVLSLLDLVRVPVMTVLHTVPAAPTPGQRSVLQSVVAASDILVTMTETARDRLLAGYRVDPRAVRVIPHGVAEALVAAAPRLGILPGEPHRHREAAGLPEETRDRPIILTWGLLGPGKGIEWGIEAMAALSDLSPRPIYVVAGQTHPRVLHHDGESYRDMLAERARELGVEDDVLIDGRYLDDARLHRLIRTADIVLLPYDSREQVTSGVLVEAVCAGRVVVSTHFPHAVELLGDGTGLLVEQSNPSAIALAARSVLTRPRLAGAMRARARRIAPSLTWRNVARSYVGAAPATRRPDLLHAGDGEWAAVTSASASAGVRTG